MSRDPKDCELCPIGHYQPTTTATTCLPCPLGKTTADVGANSVALCIGECSQRCYRCANTSHRRGVLAVIAALMT